MSDVLSRVLGRAPVNEDVPVPCAVSRPRAERSRPQEVKRRKFRSGALARVLGEAEGEDTRESDEQRLSVIPSDAEEVDAQLVSISVNVKGSDSDPEALENEQEFSPYKMALVPADILPEADTMISPLDVPGNGARVMSYDDVMNAPTGLESGGAVDTLLGKDQTPMPGRPSSVVPPVQNAQQRPTDQELQARAESLFGTVTAPAAAPGRYEDTSFLGEGQPMPDHRPSDGRHVTDIYRKFCG